MIGEVIGLYLGPQNEAYLGEMKTRFHLMHHLDNPCVHSSTLFNTDTFGNSADFHILILHAGANVWPIHGVELSLLAVKEEGITKS